MKFNNNEKANKLVLENCYYCILFNLDSCSFNYKKTDNIGHVFYYNNQQMKIPFEFYVKNIYDINSSKQIKNIAYTKTIKSFSNDIVDYSSELDFIKANSTISNEYSVRNILYDNLDYWSSEVFFKPKCQDITLEVNFLLKNLLIVN